MRLKTCDVKEDFHVDKEIFGFIDYSEDSKFYDATYKKPLVK